MNLNILEPKENLFATTGKVDLSIIIITLNEEHNIERILKNLSNWAKEVFILDSFSKDKTVETAQKLGARIYQRKFISFGNQWNFAVNNLPITYKWTMKIDPDESISDELKKNISQTIINNEVDGIIVSRRLWFMKKPLKIKQKILRIWRTGTCKFKEVNVNEHPLVRGNLRLIKGNLEHYDSPNLHHWINKQNKYTTLEAKSLFNKSYYADTPKFFGTSLQRRMFLKKLFYIFPFRYFLFFIYHYFWLGTWQNGYVGLVWAKLRTDVMRLVDYKKFEMKLNNEYDPEE